MTYEIYFGIPEIRDFWLELNEKVDKNDANKDEIRFLKILKKTISLLQENPHHNSLNSHEIKILSRRYGMKVWESYLENNKPAAGRLFWIYYPSGSITIIGLEQHPDDNKHSYEKITLSSTNEEEK